MKQKRVLIVSHALELGGAERSLVGLLWEMNRPDIQVDLFLLRHEGELMDMIPPHVNLLPEIPTYTVLARPMKDTLKEGHVLLTLARVYGRVKATAFVKRHHLTENGVAIEYSHKYTYRLMPPIQPGVEYDAVISFLTPHYIAAHKVRAKRKICWIHTDYSHVAIDTKSEYQMWNQYDYIVAISDAAKNNFISIFPKRLNKVHVIENILPRILIERQAEAGYAGWRRDGEIKLLSVGRFCQAKNFDNVPDICRRIRAVGLPVTWYLIGYGADEKLIRKKIEESGMKEYVIVLGKKDNPYPYIKACDLYVQPSRYEGKCVAVREAQMLGKPVVITDYSTSKSQLEDGLDGIIVPLDNEGCAKGIIELLNVPARMAELSVACQKRDYSNREETDKIYQLIED